MGWGCSAAGVQVLERLWPEGAETVIPRTPAAMQGNTDHVLTLSGGKETYDRYFFGEATSGLGMLGSRVGGAGPGTRGSTGFGTFVA